MKAEVLSQYPVCGQLLVLSSLAFAEEIHDTELGIRAEAPLVSSPGVVETARGEGGGDRQLHFGWEATFSYAVTEDLFFTGLVGARRSYSSFEEVDGSFPFLVTRSQRLMLGAKYSLTDAPTFPYLSAHAGVASTWFRVEVFGLDGDRVSYGPAANVGLGLDRFLSPRFAVNLELRGWAEKAQPEQITVDPWRFESPPFTAGFSLLAGVVYR